MWHDHSWLDWGDALLGRGSTSWSSRLEPIKDANRSQEWKGMSVLQGALWFVELGSDRAPSVPSIVEYSLDCSLVEMLE